MYSASEKQTKERSKNPEHQDESVRFWWFLPPSPILHFIHSLFSIPSGQTLSVYLTSPSSSFMLYLNPPPHSLCIFPISISLTVTISYSPEATSGVRGRAVKCQFYWCIFFRILITGMFTVVFMDASDRNTCTASLCKRVGLGGNDSAQQHKHRKKSGGHVTLKVSGVIHKQSICISFVNSFKYWVGIGLCAIVYMCERW